jgi:hypothetical protein
MERSASTEDEYLANTFASYFLMPPWTVKSCFDIRRWPVETSGPEQFYTVACQLNVGYSTLVNHCAFSLGVISRNRCKTLLRIQPKSIRCRLAWGVDTPHLVVVDRSWNNHVPVDIRVGDALLLEEGMSIEGACATTSNEQPLLAYGVQPGIGRLVMHETATFLRVRRAEFVGRAIYRHLDDPDFAV